MTLTGSTRDPPNEATSSEPAPPDESTATEPARDAGDRVSDPNEALVVDSYAPVSGTNVNVGVRGVAKNSTGRWLVDCVLDVTGVVGGQPFSARATRSPLAPHGTWEWSVPFGERADALADDRPERIAIETRASFMEWG